MKRLAFQDQSRFLLKNPAAKIEPRALNQSRPQFNRQNIIVTSRRFVAQVAFDNRKNRIPLLQLQQCQSKLPKKLIPRDFKQIEVAPVIDVIADGAIGVSHAVNVTKNSAGHAPSLAMACSRCHSKTPISWRFG